MVSMRTVHSISLIAMLAACGDDGGSPPPVDSAASQDASVVDGPITFDASIDAAAPACTGAAYDPCTGAGDCDSGNCKVFMQAGIQVCTQACSGGNPCPMQNGQTVPCNNMGICRPEVANTCMP